MKMTTLVFSFEFLVLSCSTYTQASQNQSMAQTPQITYDTTQRTAPVRPRMNLVKTVDFYLRSGTLVYGKLVSEDRNKVIVEELKESKIIVSTYSKREIEPRTLQTNSLPEYRYYLDLAEYFAGRTWDFTDDPDDFIQAIRCCETAKQSVLEAQTQDSERIEEIDKKIQKLQADRQVWTREVESRAKLKQLEFEAESENRIKQLQDRVDAGSQEVNKTAARLDQLMAEMKDNHLRLEQSISAINQDMSRRLNMLADQVEASRRIIDPWRSNLYPRYYYPYRPYYRPGE